MNFFAGWSKIIKETKLNLRASAPDDDCDHATLEPFGMDSVACPTCDRVWRVKWKPLIRPTKAQIEHAIDHFEPPFIAELANERETWIADNMRHEILTMVRRLGKAV